MGEEAAGAAPRTRGPRRLLISASAGSGARPPPHPLPALLTAPRAQFDKIQQTKVGKARERYYA